MTIAAIVVTYHPKEVYLNRVLESVAKQVDAIYVIDNTPSELKSTEVLQNLQKQYSKHAHPQFHLHLFGENKGIASAQNIGIQLALQGQHQNFVFFDQDSAPPVNLVETLLNTREDLERHGKKIGAVGPMILDEKSQYYYPVIKSSKWRVQSIRYPRTHVDPIECDCIISSGSLISKAAIEKIEGMLDCLFIDWVDVEWCLRARRLGYVNYIVPAAVMHHSIGDEFVQIGKKSINIHSDIRHFYIVRNSAYLILRGQFPMGWRISMLLKLPQYLIFYTFISTQSKWTVFKGLVIGICNGLLSKMGPAPAHLFKSVSD
jgi:rhamnosyltransferase